MVGDRTRDYVYGEFGEDAMASRMVVNGQYKLIYYPVGNRIQLFNLEADPNELCDVAAEAGYSNVRSRLAVLLLQNLYGGDLEWVKDGELVGLPDVERTPHLDYTASFGNARGYRIR